MGGGGGADGGLPFFKQDYQKIMAFNTNKKL